MNWCEINNGDYVLKVGKVGYMVIVPYPTFPSCYGLYWAGYPYEEIESGYSASIAEFEYTPEGFEHAKSCGIERAKELLNEALKSLN